MTIRISGIESESIVDGPGFRFALYTQGCPHGCPGCHNPQTHSFEGGKDIDVESLKEMVSKSPLNKGVTLSGGEPMCQAAELIPFAQAMKDDDRDVWIYSGYTYEQLTGLSPMAQEIASCIDLRAAGELISLCDVLVDGRYVQSLSSYDAKWRGSTNQRVIDLKKTEQLGEVVLLDGSQKGKPIGAHRDKWR